VEDFNKIKESTNLDLNYKQAYLNLQKMLERERAKDAEITNIKG